MQDSPANDEHSKYHPLVDDLTDGPGLELVERPSSRSKLITRVAETKLAQMIFSAEDVLINRSGTSFARTSIVIFVAYIVPCVLLGIPRFFSLGIPLLDARTWWSFFPTINAYGKLGLLGGIFFEATLFILSRKNLSGKLGAGFCALACSFIAPYLIQCLFDQNPFETAHGDWGLFRITILFTSCRCSG